jgi:hypothetical protein
MSSKSRQRPRPKTGEKITISDKGEFRGKKVARDVNATDMANTDPVFARRFLKKLVFKGRRPIFPLRMADGRVVDGDTATDEDVTAIMDQIKGSLDPALFRGLVDAQNKEGVE